MSIGLRTQTIIAAPPERVWSIVTNFAAYPSWNPFVKELSGELRLGAKLDVRISQSGGGSMRFKPTVTDMREGTAFEWLGHLLVPGLVDGRHRFELAPAGGGTTFTQSETFNGILVPLVASRIKAAEAGFDAFNAALKARAEAA